MLTQTEMATVAVTVLVIGALILSIWAYIRWHRSAHRALQRLVRSVSRDVLVDVFIPDGAGGEIHIDHLLLTPHGLMLLETKDVKGTLFAGERMQSWSATHRGARITFDNPIPMLQERAAAVGLLAPGVPIESRVLFIDQATFPKGHPSAVATIATFLADYAAVGPGEEAQDFSIQWETIKASANRSR